MCFVNLTVGCCKTSSAAIVCKTSIYNKSVVAVSKLITHWNEEHEETDVELSVYGKRCCKMMNIHLAKVQFQSIDKSDGDVIKMLAAISVLINIRGAIQVDVWLL